MPYEKKSRVSNSTVTAVLCGVNLLLWCSAVTYGLSQLVTLKQQVLDLPHESLSSGQQAASALDVHFQEQLDSVRVDVERLQTSHQEFNQMWVSLATKVLRKDNII